MKCAACKKILGDDHYLTDIFDTATGEYYVLHCCRSCSYGILWKSYKTRFNVGIHRKRKTKDLELVPLRIEGEKDIEMLV